MRRIGSGRSGEWGVEDRENRGREIRRIGGGRSGEQGGDEENREWEIG